jgi:hypothetical protein
MMKDVGWGADLISPFEDKMGLEDFALENIETNVFAQGPSPEPVVPWFNPASIVAEKGVFFVSLYVCRLSDNMSLAQRLAIWFGSLKETDHVKLSVASTVTGIPFSCLMTLLSAVANTRAKVDIILDQIVMDGLAYFYLLADQIIPCHAGGLFVQSFVEQRREDNSGSWKAVHDFYHWIVEDATARGILTSEESEKLINGLDVIVPLDRFVKNK